VVVEKLEVVGSGHQWQGVLASLVELYRNIGEFKVELGELFITEKGKIVYLPFYKNVQTSSKFYAQFHNKSVLAELFARVAPMGNKNRVLEVFIQHIDSPNAYQAIAAEMQGKSNIRVPHSPSKAPNVPTKGNNYPQVKKSSYPALNEKSIYPSL